MKYFKRIYLLYLFGFLSNFRPADPFIYEYFISCKNFPPEKIRQDVLPAYSYSTAIQLIFVFFLFDFCKYSPFIVISSITAVVAICIRIWNYSVSGMEAAKVFSGTSTATELAYYISVYTYYDISDYKKVTSYIRAVPLASKMASSLLAQLAIRNKLMDYNDLNYINLTAFLLALVTSIFIPVLRENVYRIPSTKNPHEKLQIKLVKKAMQFKSNFIETYSQKYIKRWSIWTMYSLCSYTQVATFIQPLWKVLHVKHEISSYNGAVDALLAVLSIFAVLIAGVVKINWRIRTVLLMHVLSALQYSLLFSMSWLSSVILHYASYVLFGAIHHFVITAISGEIAQISKKGGFGIVFGFIYLVAGVLNAVIVGIVNDDIGYRLEPEQQFFAYFLIHVVMYAVFFIASLIKLRVDTIMERHQQNHVPVES